ncbi:hypothetical protein Dimus_018305, partial [Dionaea muscipula]
MRNCVYFCGGLCLGVVGACAPGRRPSLWRRFVDGAERAPSPKSPGWQPAVVYLFLKKRSVLQMPHLPVHFLLIPFGCLASVYSLFENHHLHWLSELWDLQ